MGLCLSLSGFAKQSQALHTHRPCAEGRGEAELRERSLLLGVNTEVRQAPLQVTRVPVGDTSRSSSLRSLMGKTSSGEFAGTYE